MGVLDFLMGRRPAGPQAPYQMAVEQAQGLRSALNAPSRSPATSTQRPPTAPAQQPASVQERVHNPTEQMLFYPAYPAMHGASTWYAQNIAEPFSAWINKSLSLQNIERTTGLTQSPGNIVDIIHTTGQSATGLVAAPGMIAEFLGMVPPGGERLAREGFRDPATLLTTAASGLILQGEGILHGYQENPGKTAGELVGTYLLMKGGSRAMRAISPIGFGTAEVPTGRILEGGGYPTKAAGSVPETFKITGIYARNPLEQLLIGKTEFLQTKPIMGITHGTAAPVRPFIGSPTKALGDVPIGGGYLPQTLTEWALIRPTMESRLAATGSLKYFTGALEARKLGYSPLTRMGAAEPWGTVAPSTIPEQAWPKVMEIVQKHSNDIVVYGSTTERAMLGKYSRFKLGDLDLDIRPAKAKAISEELYNAIKPHSKDLGPLTHESSKLTGDAGRYTARLSTGEIVLDLHPHWEPRWSLPRSELVQSSGVQMMPIGRTLWGKTMFFLNYKEVIPGRTATIEHYAGRFKDPVDISLITRKMAADLATEKMLIDVGGLRAEARGNLAARAARISDTFSDYVYSRAPEGIELLRQAKDPLQQLQHVDLSAMPRARFNIEPGFQVKFVPARELPRVVNSPSPTLETSAYLKALNIVVKSSDLSSARTRYPRTPSYPTVPGYPVPETPGYPTVPG